MQLPIVKALSAYVTSGAGRPPAVHAARAVSLVTYKVAADIASKAVTLVITVAAARTLSPHDFGVMALAMTTGWLLGVASDAGLPMYAATRIARAHASTAPTAPIAHAVLGWRTPLAVVAAVAGAVCATIVAPGAIVPFLLIVIHQLLGAVLDTVSHVYRGIGRTDIESTLTLGHRGALAVAALTVLAVAPSLLALATALVIPPLVALVVTSRIVSRVTTAGADDVVSPRMFVCEIAPLGLGVLLSALYFRIDVYFLERLHGIEVVGQYNAAFRLVDALRLFPAAVLAVAYPTLCAATSGRPAAALSGALGTTAAVVAGVVFVRAPDVLRLVYGDGFAGAAGALRVLALAIPLFAVNYALTHQVIAWGGQRAYLGIAAAALIANVAGNALLIPDGQMIGAAYSTLVTELVVSAGCLLILVRR